MPVKSLGHPHRAFRPFPVRRLAAGAVALALPLLFTTCQVDKLFQSPATGTLLVAPLALDDSAAVGSTALRVRTLQLMPQGAGSIGWQVRRAQTSAWLGFSATTGSAPDTASVQLDPTGLAVGVYRDTLIVSSSNADAEPLRIPVAFTIHPCRDLPVALDTLIGGALTASDCASPAYPGRYARRYLIAGVARDSLSIVLQATGFAGHIAVDTVTAPPAPPAPYPPALAESDQCGGVAGDPCLHYLELPASADYVVEVTSAAAGQTGAFSLSLHRPRPPTAPDTLAQFLTDTATVIAVGGTTPQLTVVVRASVRDPDGVDTLTLEAEVQPVDTLFKNAVQFASAPVALAGRAPVVLSGLLDNTVYHWHARTRDQTGRTSAWVSFGGNSETQPDFATSVPQPPALPAALQQYKGDGITVIPVGGTSQTRTAVFKATVTDPDPGDQLRLEVEVKPVGSAFTNVADDASPTTASGGTAVASVAGLADNTSYHWQARTLDAGGRASAWVPFGNNAESAVDFQVSVPANLLVFAVQPQAGPAGSALTPAVEVHAQDALGNTVTGFTDSVRISLAANPAGGTLSGTTAAKAVAGVATFPNLVLDRAGTGYRLQAASASLITPQPSDTFSILPGAPAQLVFTTQPTTVAAGDSIKPPVVVDVRDAQGNTVTGFLDTVTMAIGTNPTGGVLSGTKRVAAAAGVASFADLSINMAGMGYTLTASALGLNRTSTAFDVVPQSSGHLEFSVEPSDAVAGVAIAPAMVVTAKDALGNTITTFADTVTLTFGVNAGGGALLGTTKVKAQNGAATFANVAVDKTGAGYTLVAAGPGLVGATSASFTIDPAAAASLVFGVGPFTVQAGSAIQPAVQVAARDAFGNAVPAFADSVAVAIAANPAGGTLGGTRKTAAVNGVASFADLTVDKAASGYTLAASSGTLTGAISAAFTVTPGPAARLAFTVEPTTVASGAPIAPAVQVTARDAFGNVATTFGNLVSIAIGANPAGGLLAGTTSIPAASGVATFTDLQIDKAGSGYTLIATGSGLVPDTSIAFDVLSGSAGRLAVFVAPAATAQSGIPLTQQPAVQIQDANGNPVAQAGVKVVAVVASGPGGAVVTGDTALSDAAGLATFATLAISGPVGTYTLGFTAAGLFPATSGAITLSAGPAARLAIVTQPAAVAQSGVPFTQQPALQVVDGAGNAVAQAGTKVGAAIASGGGTLSGTDTVVTDAAGMAAYTDLTLTGTVGLRTLAFGASGLGGVTSTAIDLQAGLAAAIALNAGDGQSATAGTAVAIAPSVLVTDASGNPVAGTAVTFAVPPGSGSVNPVTPILTGTNGIAAATSWTLGTVAGTYQLSATATGSGISGNPVIFMATATVGAPVAIVKSGGDSLTGPVSTTLATPHEVTVQDVNGNGVPDVLIAWSSSNGSVSPTLDTTDALGKSTTIRTLGAVAGTFTTTATAPTIAGSPSVTFTVFATSGGASQMFADSGQNQTDTVGQTLPIPLVVRVTDASSNPVPNVTVTWSVTKGNGALVNPSTVTDVNGRVRTGWTLGPLTNAQEVQATAAGSPVIFVATPLPGPASAGQSSVTASPGTITASTGGSAATVTVTARDANGNLIPGAAVSLAASGGNNTLTPASGTANGSGVFTATLSSTLAELKTVTATITGTTVTQQPTVTVQPAIAAKLFVLTQPSTAPAGVAINPAVQVSIRDQFDNRVTTATNGVSLTIQTNPGGGALTGGGPVAAVGGVATFSTLAIDKTGTGYVLAAGSTGLTGATTTTFDITAGTAATLTLTSGSGQTDTVAATLAQPYTVRVTDAFGNGVSNVSVAWQALTGGGSLPATSLTNASGFASATRTLGTVAGPHSSQASVTGLSGSPVGFTSTATPASPNKVGFTVQPTAVAAGAAITPAVQVAIQDQFGNTETAATDSVFMAIGTNPAGGTLSGTLRRAASAGLANFNDISLDQAAAGYTLTATATGLNGATSGTFTVSPTAVSATHSTVVASPGTITASSGAGTSTITVTARDQFDNPVPNATVVATASGTGNTLVQNSGTSDAAGVVTATLSSTAAAVKTVSATINGTAVTQTATVTVLAAPATQFAFRTQPSNVVAGASIAPAVEVSARDQFGNRDSSFVGLVTLGIGTNPGGGVLTGTTGSNAVLGLATFANVQVTKAGAGYTLTGGDGGGGLTDATSTAFNVAPGTATKLAFTVQPAGAVAGVTIAPAVQIAAQDALGNTDTTFTDSITVVLAANPGGGSLSGTLKVAAVAGVATFSTLSVDKAAPGYMLGASSGALTGATSNAFTITAAPAAELLFTVQPSTVAAGTFVSPAIQVTARDGFGNVATGFTSSVSLSLIANPTSTTLKGVTTRSAVAGVAVFDSVSIDAAGTGYTVAALASGLNGDTSTAFTVTPGAARRLAYTVQPTTVKAGQVITPAVQVVVQDSLGNTVPTYVGSVALAFGTNPGGATLGGTPTQPVASGVAVFGDLTVNQTGTGYTLTATSGTLLAATSAAFNVTPGNATQLAFLVQPTTIIAGGTITPAVQVAARDSLGNTDTTFTGTISLAIASNPGGATLTGGGGVAAVAGVATFASLSLDKSGSGYTLQATSGTLTAATSAAFTVNPGTATQLIFDVQPSTTVVNGVITPAIRVRKADAFGNIVVNPRRTIQLSIAAGTGGAVLGGTTQQQTGNAGADTGVAVFNDLTINLVGANYVLRAHSTAGTAADTVSTVFSITPGPATQLAFTTQPTNVVAGAAIAPAVVVTARDQFGNTATGFTDTVTMAIGTNPPGNGVLSGTVKVKAVAGVASFADLHVDKVGTGYTLAATTSTLTAPPSATFNVTASGATQLVFTGQPGNVVAGVAIAPAVQVTARDSLGNVATGYAGNVTVAIATNTGGGTLGGTQTVAAVNGVATFATLFLDKTGTGYTLGASDGTLTAPASATFNVTPSAFSASHSSVAASATTLTASTGASASTITVTARDSFDNALVGAAVALASTGTANSFTGGGTGTTGGGGVFTADFSSTKAESKTVSATINLAAITQTQTITVGPDAPDTIAVQAGDAQTDTAGFPVAIPPAVVVRDQFANPVPSVDVTFAVTGGAGSVVPTTPVVTNALGIATATSWTLSQTAGPNTLSATAAGTGIGGNPVTFTATGVAGTVSATTSAVAASPGVITASSGTGTSTVTVTARDQFNNPVANASVSLAASGTGNSFAPGNTGTTNGLGVFTAALSSTVAQNQTVSATVNTVPITQTAAVFVKSAAASQLTFGQQPTTASAGVAISPAVTVIARDPFGNIDSAYATNIDVTIANNPGSGTLTGTASVAPVNGVASFGTLSIDKAGTGYTLAAGSGALTPDTSATFDITASTTVSASQSTVSAGTATITACSTGCVAGTTGSLITVTVKDQFGNPIAGAAVTLNATGSNNAFTPAATGNTNTSGVFTATLSSTKAEPKTVSAVAGGVSVTQTPAVTVNPTAAATLSHVSGSAATDTVDATLPAYVVALVDTFGNAVAGATVNWTVTAGGGTINGSTTTATSSTDAAGQATATRVLGTVPGSATATAAVTGVVGTVTFTATVDPGQINALIFSQQPPASQAANTPFTVVVTALDRHLNVATGFTGDVDVTKASGAGTLTGTTPQAAVAGVATFPDLSLDLADTYTLQAAVLAIVVVSTTFTIF